MTSEDLFCPPVLTVQGQNPLSPSGLFLQRRKEIQGQPPPSHLREHYRGLFAVHRSAGLGADSRAGKNAYLMI